MHPVSNFELLNVWSNVDHLPDPFIAQKNRIYQRFLAGDKQTQVRIKLLFDKTATEHLDIESILFLSERLRQLLCEETQ